MYNKNYIYFINNSASTFGISVISIEFLCFLQKDSLLNAKTSPQSQDILSSLVYMTL